MNFMPAKKIFSSLIFLVIGLAATPLTLRSEMSEAGIDTPIVLSNLAVPEEIGKVQERFKGNSSRTIIQIQDVHAHAAAQQNIVAILERLRGIFGIEKIALEGAWAATSLPKSRAIPTSREKQLLAETLLDDDRISGPVYVAIMSPKPISLIGIEDEASYEENRALFLTHLGKSKEIREKLLTYGTSLRESQRSTWNPDLLVFANAFGKFQETSDLGKFFPLLLKSAETHNITASDLPQITLMQDITALEKSLQKERLEQEATHLLREYKNTPWTLEELIRGGKISDEKLGLYPEIKKMARLLELRDQISLGELMPQVETLLTRVLEKLAATPAEIALWEKTERLYLARRILSLQASPEDIKTYEKEKPSIESELASADLSETLSLSLAFYAAVKKRDEIFFNKILNDPSLAGNIAVVTGGFHTDGLSQKFHAAGISYITITPDLGATSMNEKLYAERMQEARKTGSEKQMKKTFDVGRSAFPPSADGQTLSELRNAIAWVDEKFSESYEVLRATKDVRKAVAAFSGNAPRLSASDSRRILSPASTFELTAFMSQNRPEQLRIVRGWLEKIREIHGKAMLVSQISILKKLLQDEKVKELVERIVHSNDPLALIQDVPIAEVPALFLASRGIKRFEVPNINVLLTETPEFRKLAKKIPFAIMKEGYQSETFVVLPEQPISLVLYRIVALNPDLYQAAKNQAFLALLQDLVTEVLSQELPGKSA